MNQIILKEFDKNPNLRLDYEKSLYKNKVFDFTRKRNLLSIQKN